ncbi:MAG: hypothetical protein H0W88_07700 [Parachlamydiaceae bacterium]|nr:hypothetical protein [Parachlamydiaceae bacterium]
MKLKGKFFKKTDLIKQKEQELEEVLTRLNSINSFISQAVQIIKSHPNIILTPDQKNHLLNQVLHIGFKGKTDSEIPLLHKYIHGIYSKEYAHSRLNFALSLLKEIVESDKPLGISKEKDLENLLNIYKQRMLYCEYKDMFPDDELPFTNDAAGKAQAEKIVDKLYNNILEFEDSSTSTHLVTSENGDKSFILPGGWTKHYISYEFKKNKDGTYEFIIHNRGDNNNDERFHGSLRQKIGEKTYARTRVPIRISKELMQNRDFLSFIVKEGTSNAVNDGKTVYDGFHRHLFELGKGQVVISEQEKMAEALLQLNKDKTLTQEQREKNLETIHQIIKSDPNFHSIQLHGTCGESNQTSTEKDKASPAVHQALKLCSLTGLIDNVKQKYLIDKMENLKTKDVFEALVELGKKLPKDSKELAQLDNLRELIQKRRNAIDDEKGLMAIGTDQEKIAARNAKMAATKQDLLQKRKAVFDEIKIHTAAILKAFEKIADPDKNVNAKYSILNFENCLSSRDPKNNKNIESYFRTCRFDFFGTDGFKLDMPKDDTSWLEDFKRIEQLQKQLQTLNSSIHNMETTLDFNTALSHLSKTQKDTEISIKSGMKSLNEKLKSDSSLKPFIAEIEEHLIQEMEIAKKLQIHTGKRIAELQKKLDSPKEKKKIDMQVARKLFDENLTLHAISPVDNPLFFKKLLDVAQIAKRCGDEFYFLGLEFDKIKTLSNNSEYKLKLLNILNEKNKKIFDGMHLHSEMDQKSSMDSLNKEYANRKNLIDKSYGTQLEKDQKLQELEEYYVKYKGYALNIPSEYKSSYIRYKKIEDLIKTEIDNIKL